MFNTAFTGDPSDFTTSDDAFEMGTQAATHWDALVARRLRRAPVQRHHRRRRSTTRRGEARHRAFGPVVTRGVLLDIARLHGVDGLEAGYAIGARRSRRGRARAGVRGRVRRHRARPHRATCGCCAAGDKHGYAGNTPGIGVGAIEWFHDSRGRGGRDRHARVRGLAVRGPALDAAGPHAGPPRQGWCRGSSGTSTRSPPTARPTVSTSSCSRRRRCR